MLSFHRWDPKVSRRTGRWYNTTIKKKKKKKKSKEKKAVERQKRSSEEETHTHTHGTKRWRDRETGSKYESFIFVQQGTRWIVNTLTRGVARRNTYSASLTSLWKVWSQYLQWTLLHSGLLLLWLTAARGEMTKEKKKIDYQEWRNYLLLVVQICNVLGVVSMCECWNQLSEAEAATLWILTINIADLTAAGECCWYKMCFSTYGKCLTSISGHERHLRPDILLIYIPFLCSQRADQRNKPQIRWTKTWESHIFRQVMWHPDPAWPAVIDKYAYVHSV